MSQTEPLRVTMNIDGGAKGNPGPAGAGIIIRDSADGAVLYQAGLFLGETTNNVAEYSALLAALEAAAGLAAAQVEVLSDSQLVVRQMNGEYRVLNAGLKPLFEKANTLAEKFDSFTIHFIRRDENVDADRLVNKAVNLKRDVEDGAG